MKILENLLKKRTDKNKIQNMIFLIIVLSITLILVKYIWNGKEEKNLTKEENTNTEILAELNKKINTTEELEKNIENILSTIKGVGKIKILLNFSESSSIIPIYDETTTTSTTEEQDTSGGTRNVTQTESQKEIVFSENTGRKEPITQKKIMPVIQGAIITAEGAGNVTVKNNIINAIQALTGLSVDKIQVFEMEI